MTERTFAFVDLAGFTALTETHGDLEAVDLIDRFVAAAGDAVAGSGEVVKSIGDAVMLAFPTPVDALAGLERLLRACYDAEAFPLPRTGVHHGPAVEREGDWLGAAVNLAARVAAQAHGGQTLATGPVAEAARGHGVPVVALGAFALRNVGEPVELFQLELANPPQASSVDPVCRMQIDHNRAAGRLRHGDRDFWFCSLDCVRIFVADPDGHAATTGNDS